LSLHCDGLEVFDTRDRPVGNSDSLDWDILRNGDGAWCMKVDSGSMVDETVTRHDQLILSNHSSLPLSGPRLRSGGV
jgi:hypothetical protein